MQQLNELIKNTLAGYIEPEYYIDFLNVACLLNGVRNGVHLDMINDDQVIYNLKVELSKLPWIDFNTRYETTIWNTEKITPEQAMNSWAFLGDQNRSTDYWQNTAILLGNDLGYPTYTTEADKRGAWSLNLVLNYDGKRLQPVSMMGGLYDTTNINDLASVEKIKDFLLSLIDLDLYNPNGVKVFLEKVELVVD
jgi:hypothetical protein